MTDMPVQLLHRPVTHAVSPSEEDDDAYIFIDHREEESFIAMAVSERLAPEHALEVKESDDGISVVHQGVEHAIPLQFSPHDRYTMISSLANLLAEDYRFFLLRPSLDSDTHGLLVARRSDVDGWGATPGHLVPLELGLDYFHDVRVPYLGGEIAAPRFSRAPADPRASAEAAEGQRETKDSLAEPKAAMGRPAKPWWKFW